MLRLQQLRRVRRRDFTFGATRSFAGRLLRLEEPHSGLTDPVATCWGLSEGAAGMVSQVRGLGEAIGLPFEHRRTMMRAPFRPFWPGVVPGRAFVLESPEQFEGHPRLVITCGRQAIAASLMLKRRLGDGVMTVHLQDPKISPRHFDLVIAPLHDGLSGPNVLHSMGALHPVSVEKLEAARQSELAVSLHEQLGPEFTGVLIGGRNRYYDLDTSEAARLLEGLKGLTRRGERLAILTSRRTPPAVSELIRRELADQYVWDGQSENPYLAVLASASRLVVTGDSVSMISEAAATRRPLHVFYLKERRRARRFRRFHESFARAGITRAFEGRLESWTYGSPDRTRVFACLIRDHLRTLC